MKQDRGTSAIFPKGAHNPPVAPLTMLTTRTHNEGVCDPVKTGLIGPTVPMRVEAYNYTAARKGERSGRNPVTGREAHGPGGPTNGPFGPTGARRGNF